MILNFSSLDLYEQCQHKYLNRHVRRLQPPAILTLTRGGGGHEGIAHFHKTGDVHAAVELTEASIRKTIDAQEILPEERPSWERAIISAREGVKQYAAWYAQRKYTVLRTEVKFLVPIPGSEHHCWWFHKLLYPNIPFEECDDQPEGVNDKCHRPHYLTGKTDAVISMDGNIWISDHKFSGFRSEMFFKLFTLDMQGTIYCYGVKAAAGIEPRGFIINKINMPWKNQDADKVSVEAEGYFRTHLDYQRMLKWATDIANEIESKLALPEEEQTAAFRVKPRACYDYQRECWYHQACVNHDSPEFLEEFEIAPLRYHDLEHYKLLLDEGLLTESQIDPEILQQLKQEVAFVG